MKKLLSMVLVVMMLCTTVFVFTGCGGKEIKSIDDLIDADIGVQMGTTGDIYASDDSKDSPTKNATINRYNKGADAILALTQDKIDCVIIDNEPAKAFVEANEGIKILDDKFAEEEYAICVAKDNNDLTKKMNKALEELKADGTLDSIVNNFIGDDTKGKTPYVTPEGTKYPNGELHMATNAAFEPYEYTEGKKVVGIDPMIATAICDKLGYELVIDDMDFDAIITAVQTGKADFGMAGMTVTDERLKSIDFTSTYATATQVIIVKE